MVKKEQQGRDGNGLIPEYLATQSYTLSFTCTHLLVWSPFNQTEHHSSTNSPPAK